ncbi:MAG TPA: hypothetical protein VNQ76_06135 [Planctomicrobium sp.]|nr:hypothetical protein [Planctomicrobium sp.]
MKDFAYFRVVSRKLQIQKANRPQISGGGLLGSVSQSALSGKASACFAIGNFREGEAPAEPHKDHAFHGLRLGRILALPSDFQ